MKLIELQEFLCVGCLLAVEKVGRVWAAEGAVVTEVEEKDGVSGEMGGFVDENMGNSSTGLARE